jgi:hypothetical protein
MKNKFLAAILLVGAFALALTTDCTAIVNTPQGKILSITERGPSFVVNYQPQPQ